MAISGARRTTPLLSVFILSIGVWFIASLCAAPSESDVFVTSTPAGRCPPMRSRTSMRGFKEDFEAWRGTLTPEEAKLVQAQAEGEFNKNFRKSNDFKKDLPADKMAAFTKVLGKFFDSEAEDYKKEEDLKTPDYNALLDKAKVGTLDFSLKARVVEVNRDADRRYHFATMKVRQAEKKGELFPQSSPLVENWSIQNDNAESHDLNLGIVEFMKKAGEEPNCPPDAKIYIDEWVKQGVPPMGENFELSLPRVLVEQLLNMRIMMREGLDEMRKTKSEAEVEKFIKEEIPKTGAYVINFLQEKYVRARDEVEKDVDTMKAFYRSQKDMPGKTKADVLKEIWAELPKHTGKPAPPLDEEMLSELAQEPAIIEGEFKHSWGYAEKLYKSEAIDAFGGKYFLGVFETKEEAQKAFTAWNAEYEKARVEMKSEMQTWCEQENARLAKDTSGQEAIKRVLEEARR